MGTDVDFKGKHMLKPWETLNMNGVENNIVREKSGNCITQFNLCQIRKLKESKMPMSNDNKMTTQFPC